MFLIDIKARTIKDSRGQSTLEVRVNNATASSPSGKSTGKHETIPYHNSRQWNIKFLNTFKPKLEISSFNDLRKLESLIKKRARITDVKQFGANALIALEIATLRALAKKQKKELWQIINPRAKTIPVPVGNAIGGGLHSHNENHPIFQEFLIIPKTPSIKENILIMNKIYRKLKRILKAKTKNDEGAWQTNLHDEEILTILAQFKEVHIGIDIAASTFYKNNLYEYKNKTLDRNAQIAYINSLITRYNLFYVEDPLNEEDYTGFREIKKQSLISSDDLTATQISRLRKAIKARSMNAMIIKPNQNGSLLELKEIIEICKRSNIATIISHRSGETHDTAIADLAVAFETDYIKCGIATSWREAKLNRLVSIEHAQQHI